jgi:hypothetical protein
MARVQPTLKAPAGVAYGDAWRVTGRGFRPDTPYTAEVICPPNEDFATGAESDAQGDLHVTSLAYFHGTYTVRIVQRGKTLASCSFTVA